MSLFGFLGTRAVAFSAVCVAIVLAGFYSLSEMRTTLYPNTRKTNVRVRIPHSSMGAAQFSKSHGRNIYEGLSGLEGLDLVETEFQTGSTDVTLEFEWGMPGTEARQNVESAMVAVARNLPDEAQDYSVRYFAGRTAGFYAVAAYSETLSDDEIFGQLEPIVGPELAKVPNTDIARINRVDEISAKITLNQESLLSYGFRPDEVFSLVRSKFQDSALGNFQAASVGKGKKGGPKSSRGPPSGRGRRGSQKESLKIGFSGGDPYQLGDLVLKTIQGTPVRLADVAEVVVKKDLPRRIYTINGKRAVVIFSMPNENGNIADLSKSVDQILKNASALVSKEIQFKTLVNPGEYISNAIANVIQAGLVGGLLAVLVCIVFLGSFQVSFQIALSLPLSLFLSFVLMWVSGVTINLISLGGLTLSVGMIVDASIVVLENIHRHRQLGEAKGFQCVKNALAEIRIPVVASVVTSIVVFLPILATSDLTSAVLGDLATAVIFVLISSLFVALVLIPALANLLNPSGAIQEENSNSRLNFGQVFLNKLKTRYIQVVAQMIKRRTFSLAVVVFFMGALAASLIFLLPNIETEILAKPSSARVSLRAQNSSIQAAAELIKQTKPIEEELLKVYGEDILLLFGRVSGSNTMNYTLNLKSEEMRDRVIGELQDRYQNEGSWRYTVRAWNPADLPLPRSDDLKIRVQAGKNMTVEEVKSEIETMLREANIYKVVELEPDANTLTTHRLMPRMETLEAGKGPNLNQLALTGRLLVEERRVALAEIGGESADVMMLTDATPMKGIGDLDSFFIATSNGHVPFGHYFEMTKSKGPVSLLDIDGEESHYVFGSLGLGTTDSQRRESLAKAKELLNGSDLATRAGGLVFQFEDGREEVSNSQKSLSGALLMSVLLVLLVLVIQFDSVLKPLLISIAIPLGLTGVVSFLFMFSSTVSLNSLLGTILLSGLTVNNSILLVDVFNSERQKSADVTQAILTACSRRFRPIFMTTLTTLLGMLPIALALGHGANVIQPLGIAVSGGLLVSAMSTLIVIPALLNIAERFQKNASH